MLKYIFGWLKFFFNPAISLFSLIDYSSIISKKAKIHRRAKVLNSRIGSFTYLANGSSVVFAEIGKFCSIGQDASIGLANHTIFKLSTSPIFSAKYNASGHRWTNKSTDFPYKKIIVGNDVWIGNRVIILGGTNIGDGAVIGAGAIVTKDVPPYAVVVGVPAKLIKYRFNKTLINKLLEIEWWNMPEHVLKNNIQVFDREKIKIEDLDEVFSSKLNLK